MPMTLEEQRMYQQEASHQGHDHLAAWMQQEGPAWMLDEPMLAAWGSGCTLPPDFLPPRLTAASGLPLPPPASPRLPPHLLRQQQQQQQQLGTEEEEDRLLERLVVTGADGELAHSTFVAVVANAPTPRCAPPAAPAPPAPTGARDEEFGSLQGMACTPPAFDAESWEIKAT